MSLPTRYDLNRLNDSSHCKMLPRFHAVTFDANDVGRVARFWCNSAGCHLDGHGLPYFATLRPVNNTMPKFIVTQVPETKSLKNRVHIEFTVGDLEAERQRLEGLGATFDSDREWEGARWIVMQDPEGNEFCLVEADADE